MTQQKSSQWDLCRFIKTLAYFGAIPLLSHVEWFQSIFQSRPNPHLDPATIALNPQHSGTSLLLFISDWVSLTPTLIQFLSDAGYSVHHEVRLPEVLPSSLSAVIYAADPQQSIDITQRHIQAIATQLCQPAIAFLFDFTQPNAALREIWGAVDDVVMGGVSQSGIQWMASSACFAGTVSTANSGGFASIRTRNIAPPLDMGAYNGIQLRVRGDGQRYKCLLRNETTWDSLAYCATFDTVAHEWITVRIPFTDLIPVFRARTQSNAPAFDPHRICALQLMLSKFEYDGVLNPTFQPGAFQLQIESIQVYREPGADSPLPRLIAIANLPELPKLPDVLSVHLIAPNMPNLGDRCLDILQR